VNLSIMVVGITSTAAVCARQERVSVKHNLLRIISPIAICQSLAFIDGYFPDPELSRPVPTLQLRA